MKTGLWLPFHALGLLTALAPLAGSQDARPPTPEGPPTQAAVFEGFVYDPEGAPAEGVVVVSSAGGKALTDAAGRYRLEVAVPAVADEVRISALDSAAGRSRVASTVVRSWLAARGMVATTRVSPLALSSSACAPGWLPHFGDQSGTNGTVIALVVYDDGNGPALFAGGNFTRVDEGVSANNIARWDGATWSSVESGLNGTVMDLAVYDDGNGLALYAAGGFTNAGGVAANRIARWDGTTWSALGAGMDFHVNALAVHDDGSGAKLYAGGHFTSAGGVAANFVARWDGTNWSAVGGGPGGVLYTLAVYDDGSGPALHAGGRFESLGQPMAGVAKWNGQSWSNVGGLIPGDGVYALQVHDDGGGTALYVGGAFDDAGGTPADHLARWDGANWSTVNWPNGVVRGFAAYDDGGGSALYACSSSNALRRWDGSSWTSLDLNAIALELATFDDGSGAKLFVGGLGLLYPTSGADALSRSVIAWDGASWTELGGGLDGGIDKPVSSLQVHDDGSGTALYAGSGNFSAGSVHGEGIVRWEGTSWSLVGNGLVGPGATRALVVHDEGAGARLFAGGGFLVTGVTPVNRIARWDGASWSGLGTGMNDLVNALASFDDGSGPALYAGGRFTMAGGTPANRIARWNGVSWAQPAGGVAGGNVFALAAHDDGSGPALFVGGGFTSAGGAPADRIARWDGAGWAPLGSGTNGTVSALATFDDGSGPTLHVGGSFTSAGGLPAGRIARWDGSSWSALPGGLDGDVLALAVHDDGNGPALIVAGDFTTAGGLAANRIARWDGASWSALGGGMDGAVSELAVYDAGSGPALFAGGSFTSAFDTGEAFLARWGYPELDLDPPTLLHPPEVLVVERLGSPPGEIVVFDVGASDCRDPAPQVVCVPPSGSFFPLGTTMVTCSATDASGNQASAQFPVTVALKARRR